MRFLIFFLWCSSLQAQVQEVRIGTTLPLSGKLSFIGNAYLRGIQLGINQLNADEDLRSRWVFKLVVEDNGGDAARGASSAHKLVDVDKVEVLFTNTTHVATAVAPIAAQQGVLMFYAATVRTPAEKYETIFRDYFDAADSGRTLATRVLQDRRARIAVLAEQSEACESFVASFQAVFPNRAVIVASDAYSPGEADFKSTLLRLGAKSPDAIVLCAWRDTSVVMRQMKQVLPHAPPTYHWVAPFLPQSDTPEIRALLEDNHAVSTWYALPEGVQSEKLEAFTAQFQRAYSEKPRPDSAYAYDDLMALGRAMKSCGSIRSTCTIDFLRTQNHAGISGEFSFSDGRVSRRQVFLMHVEKGLWTR